MFRLKVIKQRNSWQEHHIKNEELTSAQILLTVEIVSIGYSPRRVSAPRRIASLPEPIKNDRKSETLIGAGQSYMDGNSNILNKNCKTITDQIDSNNTKERKKTMFHKKKYSIMVAAMILVNISTCIKQYIPY